MKCRLLMTIPLCKNCAHYLPSQDASLAKCKKIGTVDVVHGEIEYSSAKSVREFACGEQGTLYEPRVSFKKIAKDVLDNRFLGPMVTLMFLLFRKI